MTCKANGLIMLLIHFTSVLYSQDFNRINEIKPPTGASMIQRYTDYPVSHYTGVPQIQIPLYEITVGELRIPIKLSYHASGIKVEDEAGIVGLGWSLNSGPTLSRTMKDKADEMFPTFNYNYYKYTAPKLAQGALLSSDTQPDIFYYGLLKGSGKFMFPHRAPGESLKSPIFFPYNNVKCYSDLSDNENFANGLDEIFMKDEDGVLYKFGDNSSISKEYSFSNVSTSSFLSSWKIKEIWSKNRDTGGKVSFSYSNGPEMSRTSYYSTATIIDSLRGIDGQFLMDVLGGFSGNSETLGMPFVSVNEYKAGVFTGLQQMNRFAIMSKPYPYHSGYNATTMTDQTVNLTEISFKNGSVEFYYENPKLLHEIIVRNNQSIIRKINFFYSKYSTSLMSQYKLDSLIINNNGIAEKYRFEYNQEMNTSGYNHFARDFWGYYNGEHSNTDLVPMFNIGYVDRTEYPGSMTGAGDFIFKDTVTIGTANRNSSSGHAQDRILRKIFYPTGGYTEFVYGLNQYLDLADYNVKNSGGLRIEKIISNDSNNRIIKSYKYGLNGGGYSKILPEPHNYVTEDFFEYFAYEFYDEPGVTFDNSLRRRIYSSEPNKASYFNDGAPVYYPYVEELTEDDQGNSIGKTLFEYDLPASETYGAFVFDFPVDVHNNFHLNVGDFDVPRLSTVKTYKSENGSFFLLDETTKQYDSYDSLNITAFPYIKFLNVNVGVISDPVLVDPDENKISLGLTRYENRQYRLKKEDKTVYTYNSQNQLVDTVASSQHFEYASGLHTFPTLIRTLNSDQSESKKHLKYPLDYPINFTNDNFSQGLRLMQTLNSISEVVEEVNVVDDIVINATVKTFKPNLPYLDSYFKLNGLTHINLFDFSQVNSGSFTKDTRYESDYQVSKYSAQGHVVEMNKREGPHISYRWGYNSAYPIAEVKNAKEEEFLYEDFEGNGSIAASPGATSQTGLKGFSGTLNLGNHFKPSLNGKKYLLSYYKLTGGKWDYVEVDYTGQSISGTLDNIRIYPTDAEMTTYTYEPLVGMKSMTDASGKTVYYEYDDLQRLKFIKDQDGMILKKYDYHYKP